MFRTARQVANAVCSNNTCPSKNRNSDSEVATIRQGRGEVKGGSNRIDLFGLCSLVIQNYYRGVRGCGVPFYAWRC